MANAKQRKGLGDLISDTLTTEAPQEQAAPAEVVELDAKAKTRKKTGTVNTSLYLPRAVHRQMKELAFTEDVKIHDLCLEALDMLFKQRGLKSIDDLKAL